jgi:Killing trait
MAEMDEAYLKLAHSVTLAMHEAVASQQRWYSANAVVTAQAVRSVLSAPADSLPDAVASALDLLTREGDAQ